MAEKQDLIPGQHLRTSWRIARYQPIRAAAAFADFNPLHLDRDLAMMLGFKELPLQAECLLAFCEHFLTSLLGGSQSLQTLDLRFVSTATQGDLLELEVKIGRQEASQLFCQLLLTIQSSGEAVAEGEALISCLEK